MKSYAGIATLALAAGASAQTNATFILTTSNPISPTTPTTTVRVLAAWDQPGPPGTMNSFVFGHGDYDLVASDGEFTSARLLIGMNPPNDPGTPSGNRVNGALIGQVIIPGVMPNTSNPFPLAEYTWTTTDFTPRTISLSTEATMKFFVWPFAGGPSIDLLARGEFTPGFGIIPFIPAAPTLALLGACALLAARRRR